MSVITGRVAADDTVLHAAQTMQALDLGCLTVGDDDHDVVGMITDRDITLGIASGCTPETDLIGELIQGRRVITIDANEGLEQALMTMMLSHVRRLPVLSDGRLVGVISAADLALEGVADAHLDAATPH